MSCLTLLWLSCFSFVVNDELLAVFLLVGLSCCCIGARFFLAFWYMLMFAFLWLDASRNAKRSNGGFVPVRSFFSLSCNWVQSCVFEETAGD